MCSACMGACPLIPHFSLMQGLCKCPPNAPMLTSASSTLHQNSPSGEPSPVSHPRLHPLMWLETLRFCRSKALWLLGETSKIVPISPQRVYAISADTADVKVTLKGAPGETVRFFYILGSSQKSVTCIMSPAGTAVISFASDTCESIWSPFDFQSNCSSWNFSLVD